MHFLAIPQGRRRAVALGIMVGFVGAAGAVIGLAIAGDNRIPGAPEHTLMPGEPSDPPGATPVTHLAPGEERRVGRFRILPVGTNPESRWPVIPEDPSAERGVDLLDETMVAAAQAQGLPVARVSPPQGFKLTLSSASWFPSTAGGSPWLWREFHRFEGDGFFPADVSVRLAKPGAWVDLTDYDPSTGHTWAESDIDGVTVMFVHGTSDGKVQPIMQAFFFLGDYLVNVDAPALPPGPLDEIVRTYITDHRTRLERATAGVQGVGQ